MSCLREFSVLVWWTLFFLGSTVPEISFSQISSTPSDRHTIIGARAASLADAYIADAEDVQAMYYNPASIPFIRNQSVLVNVAFERIYGNDNLITENLTLPIPIMQGWGMGFGLTYTHVGYIAEDSPLSGLSMRQFGLDLALAKTVYNALSIGLGINLLYGPYGESGLIGGSAMIGAYYAPSPGISYGISYQTAGRRLQYAVENGVTVLSRENLHQSLQIGLSILFPTTSRDHVACVSLASQKSMGDVGLIYKGGIEVLPFKVLALRVGYWVGPSSAVGKYGVGLLLGSLTLDYALSPAKSEPQYHQVSLSLNFWE